MLRLPFLSAPRVGRAAQPLPRIFNGPPEWRRLTQLVADTPWLRDTLAQARKSVANIQQGAEAQAPRAMRAAREAVSASQRASRMALTSSRETIDASRDALADLIAKSDRGSSKRGGRDWLALGGVALGGLVLGAIANASFNRLRTESDGSPVRGQSTTAHSGAGAMAVAGLEADRGRQAESPHEIPARGWKDIIVRVWQEVNEDRILSVAAGVTFFALLAIFPTIAALVALYGLFADAGTIYDHLNQLAYFLPQGAMDVIGDQIRRIAAKSDGALSLTLVVSVLLSLWSANAGMKAMFDALNLVYEEDEKRGFFKLNAVSLTFTFGAVAFVLLSIGAIVAAPIVLSYVGVDPTTFTLLTYARWPLLLIVLWLGLSLIYRYGPSRTLPKWRWVTWGSTIAALLWIAGSAAFSYYVANFASYNETYGSLGAVIGFMMWIWLSAIIVLVGGEINAEIEHQTARDSTEGGVKPLGARGAQMADTVGASAD